MRTVFLILFFIVVELTQNIFQYLTCELPQYKIELWYGTMMHVGLGNGAIRLWIGKCSLYIDRRPDLDDGLIDLRVRRLLGYRYEVSLADPQLIPKIKQIFARLK